MIRHGFVFASCLLLAQPGDCAETLQLLLYTPIHVDAGATTASTTLQLWNPNKTPLPYSLVIQKFQSRNTNRDVDAVVTFYGPDNKPTGPMLTGEAKPNSSFPVRVDFAHLVEAGEMTAELLSNNQKIADLKAARKPGPFKVTLEGNPPEKPEIALVRNTPSDFYLKNDDPTHYPISWELFLKGRAVSGSVAAVPNASTKFTIRPEASWFSLYHSFFKDEAADGKLIVRYQPPGGAAADSYPSSTIPVKALLSFYDPGTRDFVAIAVILFILALGGLVSSYVNVDLVNRIKANGLKKRLDKMARATGEIGPQLSSQLRVSLLLDRGRIDGTLPHGFLFTPETAALLAQSGADTDALEVRVSLAAQISDVTARQSRAIDLGGAAPSLMDRVTRSLSAAQDLLKKSVLSAVELQRIQSLTADAVNVLDNLGTPDPNLAQDIAGRLQDLRTKFTAAVLADPICLLVRANAPVPFVLLSGVLGTQAEQDANTRKLAIVYDLIQMGVVPNDAMIEYLRRQDLGALTSAELLLREVKEEVGFDHLRDAISADPPQLFVVIDRDTVRDNQAIMMRVVFNQPRYNQAAAKRLIECKWSFDHNSLTERGWEIYHYFPAPRDYEVRLTFKDLTQADIPSGDFGKTVTVSPQRPVGLSHTAVEVQRWAAGFVVAIIGLFAGAKDKIFTLDTAGAIIAVFLLGFTVDMAKNLLVAKQ